LEEILKYFDLLVGINGFFHLAFKEETGYFPKRVLVGNASICLEFAQLPIIEAKYVNLPQVIFCPECKKIAEERIKLLKNKL